MTPYILGLNPICLIVYKIFYIDIMHEIREASMMLL